MIFNVRILIILIITVSIYSQELDKVYVNSPLNRFTDNFYIKNGAAPPFFSRPLLLNSIPTSVMEKKNYEDFYLESNIFINLKGFYLSRSPEERLLPYWYNRWLEQDPLFNLGFITGNNYFHIRSDFDVRADFPVIFNNTNHLNIPVGDLWYQDFDFNFPSRGFIVVGSSELNLLLGRDKIHFGPGQKVGLFLSKESSFFNQALLSFQGRHFKGTFFTLALESYLTDDEKSQIDFFLDPQNGLSDLWRVKFEKELENQSKIITGHRFEFKPVEKFIISFNDMLVLGGRLSNFEDMTPTMFFHNIYGENYSNVMIGFDLFWTVFAGLSVYGEYVIDDIRNIHEDDLTVPTSMAYLLGAKYVMEVFGGDLSLSLEGSMVDDFAYRRWNPLQSFYNRRKYFSIKEGSIVYDNSVGAFLGPGSRFFSVWSDFDIENYISISTGCEYWYFYNGELITQDLITAYRDGVSNSYSDLYHLYFKIEYFFNSNIKISAQEILQIDDELFYFFTCGITYKF